MPLGGTLSKDPTAPGFLHEGLIAFNHTVSPLSPTMVFDFKRDSEGVPTSMHVYACLGKIPPIVGKDTFSYLLYVKDPDRSSVEIDDLVAAGMYINVDVIIYYTFSDECACRPIITFFCLQHAPTPKHRRALNCMLIVLHCDVDDAVHLQIGQRGYSILITWSGRTTQLGSHAAFGEQIRTRTP